MTTASVTASGATDDRQHVRTFEQGGQAVQSNHGQGSVDPPFSAAPPAQPPIPSAHSTVQWNSSHGMDSNFVVDSSNILNSNYYHHQPTLEQNAIAGGQAGQPVVDSSSSASSSSSIAAVNGYDGYNGYTSSYPSAYSHYSYESTNYPGYNYGYPQQGNHSYSQHVGAYQNSGAPYQPINSFQNASSYTDSTNYPSTTTYYNAGVYQNSEGYRSTGFSGHTGSWSGNNYGNYEGYSNYSYYTPSDSSCPNQNQNQEYQSWEDYYRHSGSDVTCAPGTEPTVIAGTSTSSSLDCPIPGVSNGYSAAFPQPPPPGTQPSWQPDSNPYSEALLPQQVTSVGVTEPSYGVGNAASVSSYQSEQYSQSEALHFKQVQHQPYFQQSSNTQPAQYHHKQEQQQVLLSKGQKVQTAPTLQSSHNVSSSMQSVSSVDGSQRRVGKLQIPTNPRIAANVTFGMPDMAKRKTQGAFQAQQPAYTSVNVKSLNHKASSNDVADAMLKPGTFPPSLFHYVERALARCKDETQKTACQDLLKEMITKASADGSLFTRDWDTEPLILLPSSVTGASIENMQSTISVASVQKPERNQAKRYKSRWEPAVEEKPDKEQGSAVNHGFSKEGVWNPLKEGQEQGVAVNHGFSKERVWNPLKEGQSKVAAVNGVWNKSTQLHLQKPFDSNKMSARPIKKARKGDGPTADGSGDSPSDTDEESWRGGLCFGSRGFTETVEERKRRESRTKRFDKENGRSAKTKEPAIILNGTASGATTKSYGHSGGGAVEDIGWDSLTVKGTCQEIEKRYLRLTSAPDPNTVRPEEVLQEALAMVQNSPKTYLYKCDQLKSIRQDLTVQRIRNEFTVKVYETHARLALEAGDMPEYNQCQSQIEGLYAEGIEGSRHEFAAYKLLYSCLNPGNTSHLLSSMARLSKDAKNDEAVKHALAVRAAVSLGNYTAFFRLYRTSSNLSACLMDLYVEKMRFEAVRCIARSYRPAVPVAFIAQVLGFMDSSSFKTCNEFDGFAECEEWLRAHGAILITDKSTGELQLNAKDSAPCLFMPEPEDAVPHGDAYLAVNDFFARA